MARVLVIDDEPDVLLLCRVNLQHAGHQVLEASDGEQGLGLARADRPDAVVLDLMLPVMDGYQVLEALRSDPLTSDLPILILTAKAHREDRVRCLESGASAFLAKPFSPDDLVTSLVRLAAMSADELEAHRHAELREAVAG